MNPDSTVRQYQLERTFDGCRVRSKASRSICCDSNDRNAKHRDHVTSPSPHPSKQQNPTSKIVITDVIKPAALESNYEVSKFDVVCGRGKSSYERPGNRRFLDIVNDHVFSYRSATQKKQKAAVLCKIVTEVRRGNGKEMGRWIKQMEDGSWWEIGDSSAREKAGQAMRVAVRMRAEQGNLLNGNEIYYGSSNKRLRLLNHYGAKPLMPDQDLTDTDAALTQHQKNSITGGVRGFVDDYGVSSSANCRTQAVTSVDAERMEHDHQATLQTAERPPILNGAQIISSLGGSELPVLGRLWLVVDKSWQPGSSDDSGIVWVGRTVNFVFPDEQKSDNEPVVINTKRKPPKVTVTDLQKLMSVETAHDSSPVRRSWD